MPDEGHGNGGIRDGGESQPNDDDDLELLEVDELGDSIGALGHLANVRVVTYIPQAIAVPTPPPIMFDVKISSTSLGEIERTPLTDRAERDEQYGGPAVRQHLDSPSKEHLDHKCDDRLPSTSQLYEQKRTRAGTDGHRRIYAYQT